MQEQLAAINARLDVTESETGLLGDACLMLADGHAERVAALQARCTLRLVRDCDGLDLD